MVLASKIFLITEENDPANIIAKLKVLKREREEDGFKLFDSIENITEEGGIIKATYFQDYLIPIKHHGQVTPQPATSEVPVVFYSYKRRTFLIVLEKKSRANRIANMLSKELFIDMGKIVEPGIDAETLRSFAEKGNGKVIFFDNVDIPDINKLSLYGESLKDTSLYNEYLKHGKPWYIVFSSGELAVGLTRNCVVTMFSKATRDQFLEYILDSIIPLID